MKSCRERQTNSSGGFTPSNTGAEAHSNWANHHHECSGPGRGCSDHKCISEPSVLRTLNVPIASFLQVLVLSHNTDQELHTATDLQKLISHSYRFAEAGLQARPLNTRACILLTTSNSWGPTFSFTDWEWQTPPSPQNCAEEWRMRGQSHRHSIWHNDDYGDSSDNWYLQRYRYTKMLPLWIASE